MAQRPLGQHSHARWCDAVIAVCCGLLVSLAVARMRQYQLVVLSLLCLSIVGRAPIVGASSGGIRLRSVLVPAAVLIPAYLLLVWSAQEFGRAITGQTLAAAIAGVVLSAVVFLLSLRMY